MGNRLFIDTNVFLDLLLDRGSYGKNVGNFFTECIHRKAILFTSVSCIQTIIYVMVKSGCRKDVVKRSILRINELITMVNTSGDDVNIAMQSDFRDLEDAILYYTAISNDCDMFITRNVEDFPKNMDRIKVLKPGEY